MQFPDYRPRRLRRTEGLRRLVRETHLSLDDLVYPMFAVPGKNVKKEIASMPGNYHWSVDGLAEECRRIYDLGIPAVILFGIPEHKDEVGSGAYAAKGIVQRAVKAVKKAVPDLVVITDVCLCEYTSHGHCGVIVDGEVDNDETLDLLAAVALSHARSGADIVAPSDMMDGRVGAIREALEQEGFEHVAILSYAAKYASAFYGPFRDAADSAPQFGDRRGYQMDPPNADEAIREVALDVQEGADIIMVKPAMPYLDIITRVCDEFDLPVAAYQVSGEYAMIIAASKQGWIDLEKTVIESLIGIKRAGASFILTYFAPLVAKLLVGK